MAPAAVYNSAAMNRRSALAIVVGSVLSLVAGLATLISGFLGNALRRRTAEPWVRVGPAGDLPSGTFQRIVLSTERRHAWIQKQVPMTVYVRSRLPREPLALLSTCSHLGCSVSWKPELDSFRCPCHLGVFDRDGNVLEGPPPEALTRLETRLEDDDLYVRLPDSGVGQ